MEILKKQTFQQLANTHELTLTQFIMTDEIRINTIMTLYYRLTWYIVTAAKDSSWMHLGTSLKHLSTDWRGGTWKQIRMYTKSNSQLWGWVEVGPFKKLFYFDLPFRLDQQINGVNERTVCFSWPCC